MTVPENIQRAQLSAPLSRRTLLRGAAANSWIDIGNQLTISRGGFLMEGRSKSLSSINNGQNVLGAQTADNNSHTIGIEHEGIYVTENVTTAVFDMSVLTCAWLCTKYGLDPHAGTGTTTRPSVLVTSSTRGCPSYATGWLRSSSADR